MMKIGKAAAAACLAAVLAGACLGCNTMNSLRKKIDGAKTDAVQAVLPEKNYTEEARNALRTAEAELNGAGVSYAFFAADLEDGSCLTYNADWKFCSQSTVKAPYVASLLEARPELFEKEKDRIREIITVSDNDAYETLRDDYGREYFAAWCEKAGVSDAVTEAYYPRNITVRDMAKIWTLMADYLERKAPEELKEWFVGTKYSAIYDALGNEVKVYTKAGWENGLDEDVVPEGAENYRPEYRYVDGDPENDEVSTNDTGLVFRETGTYLLVIFTDVPTNPSRLVPLVRAIDGLMREG